MRPSAVVSVRLNATTGVIRPLHGGADGPLCYGETVDLTPLHLEAGFPSNRVMHPDWPNPAAVDIHTVFPNFDADPTLPASYDFRRTDRHIRAILDTGAAITYRLGEPIEMVPPYYHSAPPADFEKWAEICVGIVRHYTDGWAHGFDAAVPYWEIWNEPDIGAMQWTGTFEEYYRLYEIASRRIKQTYPRLKVGGPAAAHTSTFAEDPPAASPFVDGFLGHVVRTGCPLDFFSWHCYTSHHEEPALRAVGVRTILNARGLTGTENHLNEWNYVPPSGFGDIMGPPGPRRSAYQLVHGMVGAAFGAAVLIGLQDSPLDMANFYTTDTQAFGLFDWYGGPRATYFAFKAFNSLVVLHECVAVLPGDGAFGLSVLAAIDRGKSKAAILLAKTSGSTENAYVEVDGVPWAGNTQVEHLMIHNGAMELIGVTRHKGASLRLSVPLEAPAVSLLRLSPTESKRPSRSSSFSE